MIFFTADLHFGHLNTIFKYKRPFCNVEEMNRTLIDNINTDCGEEDTLYILGDIARGINIPKTEEYLRQIRCKMILIRGNHDRRYDETLFEGIYDYQEIFTEHRKFILMHYPLMEWKKKEEGAFQLHGHTHYSKEYNLSNRNKGIMQYDVGVDANNYRPVSAIQIIDFFDTQ